MSKERFDAGSAQERPLTESLGDASVVLWFATREGKDVADDVLKDIVNAQSKLREGPDPEVEGVFWPAYRKLAKAVQPASIDSILATYSYPFGYHHSTTGKRRLTDAIRTKKMYSWLSLGILFILLFVQIFWFIGTTWRTDLETHRAELDRIAGDLRVMMLKVKAADDLENYLVMVKGEQPTNAEQYAMLDIKVLTGNGDASTFIDKSLQVLSDRQNQNVLLYENAALRGDRVEQMLLGNYKMLKFWDFVTNLVGPPADTDGASHGEPIDGVSETGERINGIDRSGGSDEASRAYVAANTGTDRPLCMDDDINEFYEILCERATAFEQQQLGVEDALVNSKATLAVVSQYLLPLLYGLIGSLAYILRTLSSEIHNVTFTRGSEIRYALRWPLGMLGGVTVALFFDPADFSGFAAITPLGLAFLAGYGVELLFTGLDRMVSAFAGGGSERPRAA